MWRIDAARKWAMLICAVALVGFTISPASLTVAPGTTVVWTNRDSAAHTVTADDGSWGSGNLAQGDTFSHTFATAGAYTYHCAIHPFMTGTIMVTASAGAGRAAPIEPRHTASSGEHGPHLIARERTDG